MRAFEECEVPADGFKKLGESVCVLREAGQSARFFEVVLRQPQHHQSLRHCVVIHILLLDFGITKEPTRKQYN